MTPVRLRIKELRETRQWTQGELARRAGVKQATISRLEAGLIGTLNLKIAERLADAFGCEAGYLIEHIKKGGKRG